VKLQGLLEVDVEDRAGVSGSVFQYQGVHCATLMRLVIAPEMASDLRRLRLL
jgi:hypothetical protein